MPHEVGKRRANRQTFRKAALFDAAAIFFAAAALALAIGTDAADTVVVVLPSALLLLGGVGAFIQTYRSWRGGGAWPIWQGAGWLLFVLSLVYMGTAVRSLIAA